MQLGSETIIGIAMGALATGLVGGAGYLLKRWITDERAKERAEELSVLASVAVQMRTGDVSVAEIDALRKYLRHGLRLENFSAPAIASEKRSKTQLEMNDVAIRELENSYDEMREVLNQITMYLDKNEIDELLAAQVKWQEFKLAHANFVSKIFEGGSMRPLWFITTTDIATRDRINELRGYLEARRDS